ncbi:MAG: trypsin-like peptidase domain-containing protein [Myxococcota bacterium]
MPESQDPLIPANQHKVVLAQIKSDYHNWFTGRQSQALPDKVVGIFNDLAIIKIEPIDDIPFMPIAESDPMVGDVLTALGEGNNGYFAEHREFPDQPFLEEALYEVQDPQVCATIPFPEGFPVPEGAGSYYSWRESEICGTSIIGATCYGDSGAPVLNSDGEAVGINAFGLGPDCGVDTLTGTTNLVRARDWIMETVCKLSDDKPDECFVCDAEEFSCGRRGRVQVCYKGRREKCIRERRVPRVLMRHTETTCGACPESDSEDDGICLARKERCSSSDECCSGRCRGRRGRKRCA